MCAWKSELYCTAFNKQQLPPSNRPEIVFVGRSNVGKSTLINALLARKIAKVSSSPGKTRSINFYNVEAEGRLFSLVDIPGYGYAARGHGERQACCCGACKTSSIGCAGLRPIVKSIAGLLRRLGGRLAGVERPTMHIFVTAAAA